VECLAGLFGGLLLLCAAASREGVLLLVMMPTLHKKGLFKEEASGVAHNGRCLEQGRTRGEKSVSRFLLQIPGHSLTRLPEL
jgi:hypothetical protein